MKESFNISGENLLRKVREIIEEGNATSISIQDKHGKDLMHFPLAVGLVGTLFAPVLAAVGAMAAIVGDCTITVERKPKTDEQVKPDDVFSKEE
jgi:hypothetical protein